MVDGRSINMIIYKVTGFDEHLINYKKKLGQKCKNYPLNTEKKAEDLFKFQSKFVKDVKPQTWIDSYGNVWTKQ